MLALGGYGNPKVRANIRSLRNEGDKASFCLETNLGKTRKS